MKITLLFPVSAAIWYLNNWIALVFGRVFLAVPMLFPGHCPHLLFILAIPLCAVGMPTKTGLVWRKSLLKELLGDQSLVQLTLAVLSTTAVIPTIDRIREAPFSLTSSKVSWRLHFRGETHIIPDMCPLLLLFVQSSALQNVYHVDDCRSCRTQPERLQSTDIQCTVHVMYCCICLFLHFLY